MDPDETVTKTLSNRSSAHAAGTIILTRLLPNTVSDNDGKDEMEDQENGDMDENVENHMHTVVKNRLISAVTERRNEPRYHRREKK